MRLALEKLIFFGNQAALFFDEASLLVDEALLVLDQRFLGGKEVSVGTGVRSVAIMPVPIMRAVVAIAVVVDARRFVFDVVTIVTVVGIIPSVGHR